MATLKNAPVTNVREVPCKGIHTPVGFIPHGVGEDGYGKKVSTRWEVQHAGCGEHWYKVYCACFSNVGVMYTARSCNVEAAIHAWINNG
jgi:hypothetical protein